MIIYTMEILVYGGRIMKKRIFSLAVVMTMIIISYTVTVNAEENAKAVPTVEPAAININGTTEQPDIEPTKEPVSDDILMMYIDSYASYKNDEYKQIDENNFQVSPIIAHERTLVPARFVAETFDCTVDWNGDSKEVTIKNDNHIIKCCLDDEEMTVDGKKITLDVPAQIVNDRTMLPLRALAENLGRTVDYYKGLIVIGSEKSVKLAMQSDLDNIIWEKFKCRMKLKKELKNRNRVYEFSGVAEYNDKAMRVIWPATNGVAEWRTGNIPCTEIPFGNEQDIYAFTVYNNKIYYNDNILAGSDFTWSAKIGVCDMNGRNNKILTDDAACANGMIANDKLYYTAYCDNNDEWTINEYGRGDGDLNVVDLNTGEKRTLIKGKQNNSNNAAILYKIYDDVIIYSNGYSPKMYCWFDMVTGESGDIDLKEINYHHYNNAENNIYFYGSDDYKELRVHYNETGEDHPLVNSENMLSVESISDKYIYYTEIVNCTGKNIMGTNGYARGHILTHYRTVNRVKRPDVQ